MVITGPDAGVGMNPSDSPEAMIDLEEKMRRGTEVVITGPDAGVGMNPGDSSS